MQEPPRLGNWNHAKRYGAEESYRLGMEWLKDCNTVEDWGCGPAYSRKYRNGEYLGIDGTPGFCDVVTDLRTYQSSPDGVFMRHVLEHNHDWEPILENALASFKQKMSLIFFTPWAEKTYEVHRSDGIPVISFCKKDILTKIRPYLRGEELIHRKDKNMTDTLFRLQK